VKRVGLIGFGAIGRSIARLWVTLPAHSFLLAGVCARSWRASEPNPALPAGTQLCTDVEQLLALRPECVIEAASHKVIQAHGARILRSGCSIYLLSVGCLAAEDLRDSPPQRRATVRSWYRPERSRALTAYSLWLATDCVL
jgi:aspartate dehydrogenase